MLFKPFHSQDLFQLLLVYWIFPTYYWNEKIHLLLKCLEMIHIWKLSMNAEFTWTAIFFFFQLNRNDLLGGQTPFKGMHNNPHKVCFLYYLRLWLMNCKISLTPFIIIKSPSRNILQEIPVQRNSIFKILQTKLYQFHLGQAYHFCVEVTWEKKKIKGK